MDRNIHCVILTSGTLAPLKPLISELELNIDVRIENPHIVTGDQVCVKILSNGPDTELLSSNFQNRSNPKYLQSLGLVISNLIRVIPDGVLIFFPSYFLMEKTIEFWQENGNWDTINRIKVNNFKRGVGYCHDNRKSNAEDFFLKNQKSKNPKVVNPET